jgi:hypothetical protein
MNFLNPLILYQRNLQHPKHFAVCDQSQLLLPFVAKCRSELETPIWPFLNTSASVPSPLLEKVAVVWLPIQPLVTVFLLLLSEGWNEEFHAFQQPAVLIVVYLFQGHYLRHL